MAHVLLKHSEIFFMVHHLDSHKVRSTKSTSPFACSFLTVARTAIGIFGTLGPLSSTGWLGRRDLLSRCFFFQIQKIFSFFDFSKPMTLRCAFSLVLAAETRAFTCLTLRRTLSLLVVGVAQPTQPHPFILPFTVNHPSIHCQPSFHSLSTILPI